MIIFQVLEEINKWTFDVFKLYDITQGHPLLAVTYTILQVMTNVITFFHKYFVAKFCLFKDLFPVRSAIV